MRQKFLIYLSIYLIIYLSTLSEYMFLSSSFSCHLSICKSISWQRLINMYTMRVHQSTYCTIHISIYLYIQLCIHPYSYLSIYPLYSSPSILCIVSIYYIQKLKEKANWSNSKSFPTSFTPPLQSYPFPLLPPLSPSPSHSKPLLEVYQREKYWTNLTFPICRELFSV